MEWAFSSGIRLIQNCTNAQCSGKNLGELKILRPETGAGRKRCLLAAPGVVLETAKVPPFGQELIGKISFF